MLIIRIACSKDCVPHTAVNAWDILQIPYVISIIALTHSIPTFFSLPYPLIRHFIYEYPLSSLPPSIPQKSYFLIFPG
jgi:hypothetical protein